MAGPPASRASWQATAAMLPPALHPATASCPAVPPRATVLAAIHCTAAMASSAAAGNGASGACR